MRAPQSVDGDARADATLSVGMTVGLGALGMTFAAVLLAYVVVRVQSLSWPPPGESRPPPIWPWPLGATLAAISGSWAVESARRAGARAAGVSSQKVTHALTAAAVAGVSFIAIQITTWVGLARTGVRPDSGLVASVVYALMIFHALHALAGLVVLGPMLVRTARGRGLSPGSLTALSSFWHLVTIAWMMVFLGVFVA